jgi:hypothetical protein
MADRAHEVMVLAVLQLKAVTRYNTCAAKRVSKTNRSFKNLLKRRMATFLCIVIPASMRAIVREYQ